MKIIAVLFCITLCIVCCSNNKTSCEYPVIDVVNSIGKYQKVYCSDFFSSIELIPLETRDDCLLDFNYYHVIELNDKIIITRGDNRTQLYCFSRTGKYMNKIGQRGQGPGDYVFFTEVFLNTEKPVIYVVNNGRISEYDFQGKFLHSFQIPSPDNRYLSRITYVGKNLFVSQVHYDGKNRFKYCLFDQNGDTVKTFPNHIFFNRVGTMRSSNDASLLPIRVDNMIYLKDFINDTLFVLTNMNLRPAYIFGFNNSYAKDRLENSNPNITFPVNLSISNIIGMPNYFFYTIIVPESYPRPKSKHVYYPEIKMFLSQDGSVHGIYNIKNKMNILLDTDEYLQKGIINDINGGLSVIPRYYAGNGEIVDVWNVDDMKEILTDEYFGKLTIKDEKGHQKLKELLKTLKEDDNPIVVIAKLK